MSEEDATISIFAEAIRTAETTLRKCKCLILGDCEHYDRLREIEKWAEESGVLDQARGIARG